MYEVIKKTIYIKW